MFHPADHRLLVKAREKRKNKPKAEFKTEAGREKVVQDGGLAAPAGHLAATTVECGAAGGEKVIEDLASRPAPVLAAAAIGTFKSGGSRAKRATQGAGKPANGESNHNATKYDSVYESDGTTDETDEEDEAKMDNPHEDV